MKPFGLTMAIDRLYGLSKDEFDEAAKFVQIVEVGWGLPLVWKESALRSRIEYYHSRGVKVSASGTLLEHAVLEGSVEPLLKFLKGVKFDIVEISDGIIDQTLEQRRSMARRALGAGFEFLFTVGKKDPLAQLSLRETLEQLEVGKSLDPIKVVLEGREIGRGVGIYDQGGNVRWDILRAIVSRFDFHDIIFEAPLEPQQAALILEMGPEVNLGNVSLASLASLQSERMGLRFDTFGIDRPAGKLKGGPATKFVLFTIRNYQPIDQRGIAAITQLPKRTIQKALEGLVSQGLVMEHASFEDRRNKLYRTPSFSPMEKVHEARSPPS